MRPPCKNKQCFANNKKKKSMLPKKCQAVHHMVAPHVTCLLRLTLWWAAEEDFCTWAQECDICTANEGRIINRLNVNQNSFQHCRRKRKKTRQSFCTLSLDARCTATSVIVLSCFHAAQLNYYVSPPLSLRRAALIHVAHFKTNTPSLPHCRSRINQTSC